MVRLRKQVSKKKKKERKKERANIRQDIDYFSDCSHIGLA